MLNLHKYFHVVCCTFFIVFILLFPADNVTIHHYITNNLFAATNSFLANKIFHWPITNTAITSDSRAMYLFVLQVFILSCLASFIYFKKINEQHLKILQQIIVYYLLIIMLNYGWDKLTKQQFYLPEPNLLLTPIGNVHKDILYWTTLGSSRPYNLFLGSIEVLIAILLLFSTSRKTGLAICIFTLSNIVVVNFCFDINVKLFSSILLAMALYSFANYFSISNYVVYWQQMQIRFTKKVVFPIIFILLVFLIIAHKNIQTNSYNDDTSMRPLFHGSYHVINSNHNATLPKYITIHRDNYLVVQFANDSIADYPIITDTITNQFTSNLLPSIKFKHTNATLQSIIINNKSLQVEPINRLQSKLLQPDFHASLEDY